MSEPRREVHAITSRAQWLALRRGNITASRVAALFDAHPYMTRADLAASLRGIDQGDNPAMRRGRILEPGIAVALAEEHPDWTIAKATTYHRLPDLRLGCTPDYWLGEDGLVQCKTVAAEKWDEWHGKAPLAYTLQTLCELLVTGRERGVLAVMVMSRSLPVYEFEIPRHPAAEARILAAVAEWWRAWDAGEIPAPADPAGLDELLDDGRSVDLSGNNFLCENLPIREQLKRDIGAAQKKINEIDGALKTAIGDASFAYLPGFSISYRTHKREETILPAKNIRTLRVKENDSTS